jgi:hypothetical protein
MKSGLLACLTLLVGSFRPVAVEGRCAQRQQDERVCYYVISDHSDSVLRQVYILMDEADFTEPGLRSLLDQFREKYVEPNIFVFLYSKLDQLYDFSGNEPVGSSHALIGKAPQPWNKNAKGVLIYRGVDRVIRYNTAGSERHTVVVQGTDPFQ